MIASDPTDIMPSSPIQISLPSSLFNQNQSGRIRFGYKNTLTSYTNVDIDMTNFYLSIIDLDGDYYKVYDSNGDIDLYITTDLITQEIVIQPGRL